MTLASAQSATGADLHDPGARLRGLFDPGTLRLLAPRDDGGTVTGRGSVDGTAVIAFATDATIDDEGCRLVVDAVDAAIRERVPVVGLWHPDGGGTGLATGGVAALDAVGQVFAAVVRASGRIPQLSVVLGPATGAAAYASALTDVVIVSLAGASDAGRVAGAARLGHVTAGDDAAALAAARELTVLLGRQGRICLDDVEEADLGALLPPRTSRAYDVRPLIGGLLDTPGVELHAGWAPNVVTTLGRLGGRTVGVVADNPLHLGGRLDAAGAEKAARFVRMCDALGVPLVVLADTPGHLPGPGRERDGAVGRGAKLLHAFAAAVVPRVTLITRRAHGGAYIAMNSRSLGATAVFAWPDAEIAVVGGAHGALELGVLDAVIGPAETRGRLAAALAGAPHARGAHGNIPL